MDEQTNRDAAMTQEWRTLVEDAGLVRVSTGLEAERELAREMIRIAERRWQHQDSPPIVRAAGWVAEARVMARRAVIEAAEGHGHGHGHGMRDELRACLRRALAALDAADRDFSEAWEPSDD